MTLKERFVKRHILEPYDLFLAGYFKYTIHQQKRVPMRQVLKNLFNVQHRLLIYCYLI